MAAIQRRSVAKEIGRRLPGSLNHFAGDFLRVARNATESAVCGESDFLDLRFGTDFFFVFAMLKSWHTATGKEIKIQTGR
jgi:hypothetical protein